MNKLDEIKAALCGKDDLDGEYCRVCGRLEHHASCPVPAILAAFEALERERDAYLECPAEYESATHFFDPAGYDPNDCAGCGCKKSEHKLADVDDLSSRLTSLEEAESQLAAAQRVSRQAAYNIEAITMRADKERDAALLREQQLREILQDLDEQGWIGSVHEGDNPDGVYNSEGELVNGTPHFYCLHCSANGPKSEELTHDADCFGERLHRALAATPQAATQLAMWRCQACGDHNNDSTNGTWRWNGKAWEHSCQGAQSGHFPAVMVDNSPQAATQRQATVLSDNAEFKAVEREFFCTTCKDFRDVIDNQNDIVCYECATIVATYKDREVQRQATEEKG